MDTGSRFASRIQIYLTIYLIIVGNGVLLCFAAASGYIDASALDWPQWLSLMLMLLIFSFMCLLIMFPYAYVNEQTKYQMESIIALKAIF